MCAETVGTALVGAPVRSVKQTTGASEAQGTRALETAIRSRALQCWAIALVTMASIRRPLVPAADALRGASALMAQRSLAPRGPILPSAPRQRPRARAYPALLALTEVLARVAKRDLTRKALETVFALPALRVPFSRLQGGYL